MDALAELAAAVHHVHRAIGGSRDVLRHKLGNVLKDMGTSITSHNVLGSMEFRDASAELPDGGSGLKNSSL